MLELNDLYLSELNAELYRSASAKNGTARITFSISEPHIQDLDLLMATSIKIELLGGDEESIAEIECEYVAEVRWSDGPWSNSWDSYTTIEELTVFVQQHLYPRQRERLMEITLRMGLPVFKLPLLMPDLDDMATGPEIEHSDAKQ